MAVLDMYWEMVTKCIQAEFYVLRALIGCVTEPVGMCGGIQHQGVYVPSLMCDRASLYVWWYSTPVGYLCLLGRLCDGASLYVWWYSTPVGYLCLLGRLYDGASLYVWWYSTPVGYLCMLGRLCAGASLYVWWYSTPVGYLCLLDRLCDRASLYVWWYSTPGGICACLVDCVTEPVCMCGGIQHQWGICALWFLFAGAYRELLQCLEPLPPLPSTCKQLI